MLRGKRISPASWIIVALVVLAGCQGNSGPEVIILPTGTPAATSTPTPRRTETPTATPTRNPKRDIDEYTHRHTDAHANR